MNVAEKVVERTLKTQCHTIINRMHTLGYASTEISEILAAPKEYVEQIIIDMSHNSQS